MNINYKNLRLILANCNLIKSYVKEQNYGFEQGVIECVNEIQDAIYSEDNLPKNKEVKK